MHQHRLISYVNEHNIALTPHSSCGLHCGHCRLSRTRSLGLGPSEPYGQKDPPTNSTHALTALFADANTLRVASI